MVCPCCGCETDEDCPPCISPDQFINSDRCCPDGYPHPRSAGTDCCVDDTETDCVPSVNGSVCCEGTCVRDERWCCELDQDNNPTGNCFLSEVDGQDCAQQFQYCSEAVCLSACGNPLP